MKNTLATDSPVYWIKIEDKGPILYSQNRTGFSGRIFTIYKLRSMKIDAEKNGISWSKVNDKRIQILDKKEIDLSMARVALLFSVSITIQIGLSLLGIKAIEEL